MTNPTVQGPDVSWMTAWELWAWEQIEAGNKADMSLVHEAYRVDADDKSLDDASKEPVVKPLEPDEEGVPQPIDVELWPSWQVLSARFIERIGADLAFISARVRNRIVIESAWIKDEVDFEAEVIPGNLMLTFCRLELAPNFRGAEIGGVLNISSSFFVAGLSADRLRVGGGVFLRGGARFDGEVRLPGANVGGTLECSESYFFTSPDANALIADGIQINGDAFLNHGASFHGKVRFLGANIGRTLDCSGGHFKPGPEGDGLNADSITVGGNVFLNLGALFEGTVRLTGATIGNSLDCSGSQFSAGSAEDALGGDGVRVGGSIFLNGGAKFDGKVRLVGSEVGGSLDCSGSHFVAGSDGEALSAAGVKVNGGVFFNRGARFEGDIYLISANIETAFDCSGSHFTAGLDGNALCADGVKVDGSVFLNNGARFEGKIRLIGADISGILDCSGSEFIAGSDGITFTSDGMKVDGSVFLRDGARFEGTVGLGSVILGDNLQLCGGIFDADIDLTSASVQSEVRLDETQLGMAAPDWQAGASLNLQNATIGALQGSLEAWRVGEGKQAPFIAMNLDGLSFNRLSGGVGGDSLDIADKAQLLRWLEAGSPQHADKKRGFSRSPYVATANALASAGRADAARSVRIALEKRKTGELRIGPRKWIEKYLIGPLTGYGYRPSNGLFWLMGLTILFAFAGNVWVAGGVQEMFQSFSLVRAKQWLGFSFETIVPFFDLDPVQDTFLQDQFGIAVDQFGNKPYDQLPTGLRALFMAERVAGVVVLSTLVAGLTGWAERRGE